LIIYIISLERSACLLCYFLPLYSPKSGEKCKKEALFGVI